MNDHEPFEGAENARRAKEKADRRPTRNNKKESSQDRPVDRSKESKEEALAKATEKRPGAGP